MIKVLFICHATSAAALWRRVYLPIWRRKRTWQIILKLIPRRQAAKKSEIHHITGTVRKLREENVPLIPHRARQMTRNDYLYYDYLIGMDTANIRNMIKIAGSEDSQGKIYKMLSFVGYEHTHRLSEAGDVADPWYTGDFEATYRDVKNGCEGCWHI